MVGPMPRPPLPEPPKRGLNGWTRWFAIAAAAMTLAAGYGTLRANVSDNSSDIARLETKIDRIIDLLIDMEKP